MVKTVVQRRAELASSIQRLLGGDFGVVASPDHPLVLRSVDVLVGGPNGLTAIMMSTAEEIRRPRLFEARMTLNRMALAPGTVFIHLTTDKESPKTADLPFTASLPLAQRETTAALVNLVRAQRTRDASTHMAKLQRLAQPRFANAYRLARMLKHRAKEAQAEDQRVTNQMPKMDRLPSGIDGAYFAGAPSPAVLSAFTITECDRWFRPDNGELYLTNEPAGVVFADSLPEFPGDPNKALRAAAFAGWVITQRDTETSPEEVTDLVSRFTRPQ